MIRAREPTVAVGLMAAVMVFALIVFTIVGLLAGTRRHQRLSAPPTSSTAAPLPAEQTGDLTPVPPLTDPPTPTPVQEQYDSAFSSGLAASSSIHLAERAEVPPPAYSASWPAIPVADTAESWAAEFTQRLLDIDFGHQTRGSLAAWLSAEEAPELLPGVPTSVQDKVLPLSLLDSSFLNSGPSPIPDQATWDSYARADERWAVSDLLVQPDPTYSRIVASGWQPLDQRFAVQDVSGLIEVTGAGGSTQRHFTMTLYVGSAHWHPGYGSVLVDNWKEI